MKKKLIIANWKLNPVTVTDAVKLASKIDRNPKHEAVLCPPAVFLTSVHYPRLGAQDSFWVPKGPFTGQVSPASLKSLKVKYCIVGHSERRSIGEIDEQINLKIKSLLEYSITPVLCIGYGTTVNETDLEVVDVLKVQLREALKGVDSERVVVAYEPVWAISSGDPYHHKLASPEHAEKIALFIKTRFKAKKVLYGGSSNSSNAQSFLNQENIDGLLVGGDSLLPADFNKIINLAV